MDDLSEKLAGLLNDPESMNRVRQMAESLLGEQEQQPEAQPASFLSGGIPDMLNGDELKTIMGILSRLKTTGGDSRVQLLTALRSHLSEPRREKVDTAIKMLRLLEILPFLKESGLLKL